MPTPSRAIGYFRVSTTGQSGEHHVSLDTQREHFVSYCQSQGLVAVRMFTDVATGRKDNRKEYQLMLRFLQDKTADVVVVQYLDRFGRNPKEILRRIWALQEVGVEVQATDEDIKEELILLVRAGLAGAESKKISARVKANIGKAVARGSRFGRVPYGFDGIRTICEDGQARITRFVHDPAEVAVIRKMYRMTVDRNMGYKAIADRLNSAGLRTKNGVYFESNTIRHLLANETLRGRVVYGKKDPIIVEGIFPPILSDAQWQKLRTALARRSRCRGRMYVSGYLLSGIARCGYCGGPLLGKVDRRGNGPARRRYRCRNSQVCRAKCPEYNSHSAETLEEAVLQELNKCTDREQVLKLLAQTPGPETNSPDEMKETQATIKACEKEFETHLRLLKDGHISESQFSVANEPIRKRHDALLQRKKEWDELAARENKIESWQLVLVKSLTTFAEDFPALPFSQQKAKLIELIEEIKVYRDNIEIHLRQTPFAVI